MRKEIVRKGERENYRVSLDYKPPRINNQKKYNEKDAWTIKNIVEYQVRYRRANSENTNEFNMCFAEVRDGKVKLCPKCNKYLPFRKFDRRDVSNTSLSRKEKRANGNPYSRYPDGKAIPYNLRSYCKACRSKMNKEYYAKRKAKSLHAQAE